MKYVIIGAALIAYALLLTPAFIEPTDIIISTAWLVAATAAGVPTFIIVIWMASGYIAFVAGACLIGGSLLRRMSGFAALLKKPIFLVLLVAVLILVALLIRFNMI